MFGAVWVGLNNNVSGILVDRISSLIDFAYKGKS